LHAQCATAEVGIQDSTDAAVRSVEAIAAVIRDISSDMLTAAGRLDDQARQLNGAADSFLLELEAA